MNTIKLVREAAAKLNLHVTENSNAAHAAKDLREANNRLLEIEAISVMTNTVVQRVKLNEYMEKYHGGK